MKKLVILVACLALILPRTTTSLAAGQIETTEFPGAMDITMSVVGHYDSGSGEGGTEIVAYAKKAMKMFVVNGEEKSLDIVDLSTLKNAPQQPLKAAMRIPLETLTKTGAKDLTSVAVAPDESFVAITLPADPKQSPGSLVLLDLNGGHIATYKTGALPDMVKITPDSKMILVANEGEPNDSYTIDPEGSVTIVDVTAGVAKGVITEVTFDNEGIIEPTVRKSNEKATYAQNLEPEYIDVQGTMAYVVCQESNAVATLDLTTKKFVKVHSLGTKDYSVKGNELDPSDKDDAIAFGNYPVLGMYQPDGVDVVTIGGKTYLFTANEGDAQDYDGYSEEGRGADIADKVKLDAGNYAGYTQAELDALVADGLFEEDKLGRLKITTANGKNAEGYYTALYGYGARSFAIFDVSDMSLVYDSGSHIERTMAKVKPAYFNTTDDKLAFDNRSDDKGPEPENVVVGTVGNTPYAFVGLERSGGIMVYDVADPTKPEFELYTTTRAYDDSMGGDLAPEGMTFVAAADSPTGKALLLVANEVSGTVVLYEVTERTGTLINIIHVNDLHGRVDPMAKAAALKEEFLSYNANTIIVDAGDTVHGTTFANLEKGKTVVEVMNTAGFDIFTPGNHDFNFTSQTLLNLQEKMTAEAINANITYKADGKPYMTPYVIKEFDGVKVGFFGIDTPETLYKTHPDNVAALNFNDPATVAAEMVKTLEPMTDVIVAVTHLGIDSATLPAEQAYAVAAVDGIDLIIDGHSHTLIDGGKVVNDTLIVQVGEYGENIGIVQMMVDGEKVSVKETVILEDAMVAVEDHPATRAKIDEIAAAQDVILNEVVGNTSVLLNGERGDVRTKETNLGNLITDAILWATKADLALTNGGGIRASIEAGDITKKQVKTVLPFNNYIETRELTGAKIKEALEHGASSYPETKGAFLQTAGLTYEINEGKPAGSRIENILVKGEALAMDRTYVVATNNFIAAGGDGYAMMKTAKQVGHFDGMDILLMDYMATLTTVAPEIEGRIQVTSAMSVPNHTTYTVVAGDVLWKIAEKYGVTYEVLVALNNLANPNKIFPGDVLKVPMK